MTDTTWTWARLDKHGLDLVQEAEHTLGADVVLVYAEGAPRTATVARAGLRPEAGRCRRGRVPARLILRRAPGGPPQRVRPDANPACATAKHAGCPVWDHPAQPAVARATQGERSHGDCAGIGAGAR